MSSTIIQFSDLHAGSRKDLDRLNAVCSYASKKRADALMLVGDISDAHADRFYRTLNEEEKQVIMGIQQIPEMPDSKEKQKLIEQLQEAIQKLGPGIKEKEIAAYADKRVASSIDSRLEKLVNSGVKVLGVKGNHDSALVSNLYKNIQWLDEKGVEIDGVKYEGTTNLIGNGSKKAHPVKVHQFCDELFPHLDAKQGKMDYERIKAGWKDSKKKILVSHYAFHHPESGHINAHFPEMQKLVEEEKPSAILSGHTHIPMLGSVGKDTGVFVSSHHAGYRHKVDSDGRIAETYRFWLVERELYEDNKEMIDKCYNVHLNAA